MWINRLVFIGMGGIGNQAISILLPYMYARRDRLPVNEVVIIDPDTYETRNAERQPLAVGNEGQNKAQIAYDKYSAMYPGFEFDWQSEYVNAGNIHHYVEEYDLVMMGVDCAFARHAVDQFATTLDNILLINMGNEQTDGDAFFQFRWGGDQLVSPIGDYLPGFNSPEGIEKSEVSCAAQAADPNNVQTIFANVGAALYGCSAVHHIVAVSEDFTEVPSPDELRYRGNYFDLHPRRMGARAIGIDE